MSRLEQKMQKNLEQLQKACDDFNARVPVGSAGEGVVNRAAKFEELAMYADQAKRGNARAESMAKRRAYELFPPMAKPLVWNIEGADICSQQIDFEWYRIRRVPSSCPSDDLLISCALCGVSGSANSLQWCTTIDEAKAWCESRNQTKFREQLA